VRIFGGLYQLFNGSISVDNKTYLYYRSGYFLTGNYGNVWRHCSLQHAAQWLSADHWATIRSSRLDAEVYCCCYWCRSINEHEFPHKQQPTSVDIVHGQRFLSKRNITRNSVVADKLLLGMLRMTWPWNRLKATQGHWNTVKVTGTRYPLSSAALTVSRCCTFCVRLRLPRVRWTFLHTILHHSNTSVKHHWR